MTEPTCRAVDAKAAPPPRPPRQVDFPCVKWRRMTCCRAGGIRNRARIVKANATNILTSKANQHVML